MFSSFSFLPHCSTLAQLIKILLEIARGVAHMHKNGIAHCDLKFGNVVLVRSPTDPTTFIAKVSWSAWEA
jgi:serine/threonine protein kinase